MEQILMYPDFGRFDVVLAEPVTVERGVFSGVLYRVAHPFIYHCIEISPFHRLDFLSIIPVRGHTG
jgi:hypothetical protein